MYIRSHEAIYLCIYSRLSLSHGDAFWEGVIEEIHPCVNSYLSGWYGHIGPCGPGSLPLEETSSIMWHMTASLYRPRKNLWGSLLKSSSWSLWQRCVIPGRATYSLLYNSRCIVWSLSFPNWSKYKKENKKNKKERKGNSLQYRLWGKDFKEVCKTIDK